MTQELFKFFLPHRYFQCRSNGSGMSRDNCQKVLNKAFNMTYNKSGCMMDNNPNGFSIICRPEQFARFIIHRRYSDCQVNGVRDLNLEQIEKFDIYEHWSECIGEHRALIKKITSCMGFSKEELEKRCLPDLDNVIDASEWAFNDHHSFHAFCDGSNVNCRP